MPQLRTPLCPWTQPGAGCWGSARGPWHPALLPTCIMGRAHCGTSSATTGSPMGAPCCCRCSHHITSPPCCCPCSAAEDGDPSCTEAAPAHSNPAHGEQGMQPHHTTPGHRGMRHGPPAAAAAHASPRDSIWQRKALVCFVLGQVCPGKGDVPPRFPSLSPLGLTYQLPAFPVQLGFIQLIKCNSRDVPSMAGVTAEGQCQQPCATGGVCVYLHKDPSAASLPPGCTLLPPRGWFCQQRPHPGAMEVPPRAVTWVNATAAGRAAAYGVHAVLGGNRASVGEAGACGSMGAAWQRRRELRQGQLPAAALRPSQWAPRAWSPSRVNAKGQMEG